MTTKPYTSAAEARERVATWMISHSFATGHGDTLDDLLGELSAQVAELRSRDKALIIFATSLAKEGQRFADYIVNVDGIKGREQWGIRCDRRGP